uniref:Muscle M-line assembly protein unc-89 n=1 Tax=Zeugodacus cucurbitae TaxID=28588 RepID=A0A0A1X139_ZEUCU
MDEIEYLEEYEDLILPTAMSTQAATTKGRNRTQLVTMADDDDDSSSIDQDIFDSLFDDNSDDESVLHNKKGPAKLSQRSERSSRISRVSMDSLDMLVKELGEPFNPNADGTKSTNRNTPKLHNTKVTQPNKTVQKFTTTTTKAKGSNSPTPVPSGSLKTINKLEAAKAIAERNIKAKSVATVRPTVQQNLGQATATTKSMHTNDPTTRILQGSRSSGFQSTKITSGSANSSKVASPTPSTSRKQISAATSTTGSNSNSLNNSKNNTPASKRIVERSQTTIIKPEKPQIKDPAEDPLSLENIEHESDSDSDSFIYSDVSADTFVTLSDVDFEERNIIDLSNDSNYERANLDKIRGSTPSPTVSDDYKSDKEDSPTKMLSNFDEKSKDGSVMESNANAAAKFRVRQYVEGEATTTSRQRKHEATSSSHDKSMNVEQQTATTNDTLLARIDTILSASNVNVEERKVVENQPDMEVEVVTDIKADAKEREKQTSVMSDSANACDSQMDDTAIAKPGVIQEPSTVETMEIDIDMGEIVEEVVDKEKNNLDNEEGEKTFKERNDNTTNEAISVTTVNNTEALAMLEGTEKDEHIVKATENIDDSVHQMDVVSEQVVETMEDLNINTESAPDELKESKDNVPAEVVAVSEDAVENTINTINLSEGVGEINESKEADNSNNVQEKLADETKSDSKIKTVVESVNNKDLESEIENTGTKALAEQVNFDSKTEEKTNVDLLLENHEKQCNITDDDTTTKTEETEQNQKCENKFESAVGSVNQRNEHEEDCATSSKNVKALQELQEEEDVFTVEAMKKKRGADKQRLSLRRSRTPIIAKLTESTTQNHAPTEKCETVEVESKVYVTTVDRTEDDTEITDTKIDSSVITKVDKFDEDVHEDNIKEMEKRPPSSRNKSNTRKVDDSNKVVETDNTKSQTQRKSRHDRKEDALRSDSRNEHNERSQTPRGRKVQTNRNTAADRVEKPQTGAEKNEVADTESTKEADAGKIHLEKSKVHEQLQVNEQVTPRLDKRVRGLVVSLKKTDLSKVLNEKLLRKINTEAKSEVLNDLKKSETAAHISVDKTTIDIKEQATRKGGLKETTPSVRQVKDAGVEKSTEETNKDLKFANTTEKAKEDIKNDKTDSSRRDEKSGDRSRGHSRYERSRSKSRRDRTNEKFAEKSKEHSKSVKPEHKSEHASRHDKSVIKDSIFEKSSDDAKRYSRSEKSTERSKRDTKYERSEDRAKRDSKEERTTEKSKTDSKGSSDSAKQISKEEKSITDSKYEKKRESAKKDSRGKSEYKTKCDSKEEHSKSFSKESAEKARKDSNDGNSPEKSKKDSKQSTDTTRNVSKEEKSENKTKMGSKEERSVDKFKKEIGESVQKTKYSSKETKTSHASRYEKSTERAKKESKGEKSEVKEDNDSKEKTSEKAKIDSKHEKSEVKEDNDSKEKTSEKAKIDSKHEMSTEKSRNVSKDDKSCSDSKEAKTSEKSKSDAAYDKSTERIKKDTKNRKPETKTANISEDPSDKTKEESLEKAQEPKTKSEEKSPDYRKMKWKNDKYTRTTKSAKDNKELSDSEANDKKEAECGAGATKQLNAATSMDIETANDRTAEQNLNTELNVKSSKNDTTQSCLEGSDSMVEEITAESQEEHIEEQPIITEAQAVSESVDNIHMECENKVKEETEGPTESTEKTEEETAITENIEKAGEETAIADSTATHKIKRGKRGRFSKTREKRVKRKPANDSSGKTETETKSKEEDSIIENSDKINENKPEDKTGEIEMEKELEISGKAKEDQTEIAVSIGEDTETAATIAESKQKMEIVNTNAEGENIENMGGQTGPAIEKEAGEETSNTKTETDEVLDSTDKLETQNDTQTVDEIVNQNLNEDVVLEVAALDVGETVQIQANAGTLEETVNLTSMATAETEKVFESINVNANTKIINKSADEIVAANLMEAEESLNKNQTSKTHEDIIETENEVEIAENADQSNKQEFTTQQTPTTKDVDAVGGAKEAAGESGGSGNSGTTKAHRNKHPRNFADQIIAQSPQLLSADEDEQEGGATRRSLRTRAADHSPCSRNENQKKSSKGAAANHTQSSALTNSSQKSAKEQPHSSRSSTATPTTNMTRKRMRDHTPNSTAEHSDQEKSPSKKLKWESGRKSSRMHNDDVNTSECEPDAAAVGQRAQEMHAKLIDTKDMKGGTKSGQENAASKQSTVAEVKKSATGLNLNTSKKSVNASPGATKAETAEVKRKQELEKLPPGGTTKITDANKKRRTEPESAQAVKKPDETQQKPVSATHKSAVKQPASTLTTVAKTTHAHAPTAEGDAADPLQLPVKRFKRLQAIDGYDTLNVSEERKEGKVEETKNKNATSKRKSLRPDVSKPTETTHKLTAKQSHQQQLYHKGVAGKPLETTTLSLKDRKIVVPNTTVVKNAANTDKSANKSPTKSPGSKVITFKEWLEQQKKSTGEEGGEEVLFEPDESAIRMDKIRTTTTPELKRANTSASDASTSAKQKPSVPTAVQTPAAAVASVSKDAKKKANLRDAAKRKREAAFTPNKGNPGSVADVLAKQTPPAAKHGRIEKVVTPTSTPAGAHFKRPSLPQRMPRATPTRFNNRTPTPADGRASLHSTQHQAGIQRLGTKVNLRKLRVRINRSTVAAYFKNLNSNKLREQAIEQTVTTTQPTANITLKSVAKSTEPLQKRSPQKDPLALPKRSVVTPLTATTTTGAPLLPTLTARPNVIAATESNVTVKSTPIAMPTLTKVPTSVQDKSPKKSQDKQADATQAAAADQEQFGSNEELSLLTPMKTVTTPQTSNSLRAQQQQMSTTAAPEAVHEKRASTTSSSDIISTLRSQTTVKPTNSSISSSSSTITAASSSSSIPSKDTQLPFTPVVPKEELPDEHTLPKHPSHAPTAITPAASVDNASTTNSLASRTLAIAAATNSALNQTPPTSDASGYYGLTPTQLDTNGTRLYTFLHPAKYNRNHGCVLLDYCCPNLDGPMPAIDPTRIHAQVQAGVRELPAYIVMTTKLITRADLEANKNVIPASIRQKVEKITADASNAAANHASVPSVIGAPNVSQTSVPTVVPPQPTAAVSKPTSTTLTPTMTALQKHLPSTTIITPKMMPASSTATLATQGTSPTSQLANVSDYQRSVLRTSVRQFDARLKKYYYRIAMLSFSDRQTIIDGIINSTTLTPKDVDCAVRLIDEYAAQISKLPQTSAANTAKSATPAIQSVSKAITTQTTNTVVRTTTIQQQVQKHNTQSSKNQVAVLDKDNSLLGYQLAASPMPMNKSTISTRSSIMSTSITGTANSSLPNATSTSSGVFASLKSTQDSPRIFYTKTPMQTSTPIATATSSSSTPHNDGGKTIARRGTPRMGRDVTIRQIPQKLNSLSTSSTTATATPPTARRLPTLTRNPHLTASSSSLAEKNISETITTRSAVTISSNAPKRMTRATAAAKVIVITQNSDCNSALQDECILPDGHENTEIKREKSDDDFVGGN